MFLETISKPSMFFCQTFGTKVLGRFFKTQPLKQRFLKIFKDATFGKECFLMFSKFFKDATFGKEVF